jgi:hypothetical protein
MARRSMPRVIEAGFFFTRSIVLVTMESGSV